MLSRSYALSGVVLDEEDFTIGFLCEYKSAFSEVKVPYPAQRSVGS